MAGAAIRLDYHTLCRPPVIIHVCAGKKASLGGTDESITCGRHMSGGQFVKAEYVGSFRTAIDFSISLMSRSVGYK